MAGNELLGFSTTQKRNLIRYVDEQTSGAALPAATTATAGVVKQAAADRKSTRLNSSHSAKSRMPSSA